MERFVKRFWTEEDGNTTIDWLVLTAGLVLMAAAVIASVGGSMQTSATDTTVIIDNNDPKADV